MKKNLLLILLLFLCTGCYKTELYCLDPYVLNGDRCEFEEVVFANSEVISYSCGKSIYFEYLIGNQCKYYVDMPATYMYRNGKYYYYCVSGSLIGNLCRTEYTYTATPNYRYVCPFGYNRVPGYDKLCSRMIYKDPFERKVSIFE